MAAAPRAAHAIALALVGLNKPLDILVTATETGLDVDFRGTGDIDAPHMRKVLAEAERLDLARLSNHGAVLIERRAPQLAMGRAIIAPPAGAFLQATREGEETLARLAAEGAGDIRRAPICLPAWARLRCALLKERRFTRFEADKAALAALARAAATLARAQACVGRGARSFPAPDERSRTCAVRRRCFRSPARGRGGAGARSGEERGPVVVGVSCNPQTFARDARILVDGGYLLKSVTPVDQFRHSPHVELVAVFRRPKPTGRRKGRLLG